jgi:hypothetical protein
MPALNGNTGNVASAGIVGTLNTWSATISRAMSDVTGFDNVGRNRLLGVWDMTGSAGGVLDSTSGFASSNFPVAMTHSTGTTLTLTARNNSSGTNQIVANVVVDNISANVTKTGDSSITFNFNLAATATTGSPFTIVWS